LSPHLLNLASSKILNLTHDIPTALFLSSTPARIAIGTPASVMTETHPPHKVRDFRWRALALPDADEGVKAWEGGPYS